MARIADSQPDYSALDEKQQVLLSVLMESRSLRIRALAAPDLLAGASIFGVSAAAPQAALPLLVDPASLRHLLAAMVKRGWVRAPSRHRGLLPPLAVELAHPDRHVMLALYSFVPGQRGDPEAAFDLLWDKRAHRTLRATAVPVIDQSVIASSADARPLPSSRYTSARLVIEIVSDPMRWCLAYAESSGPRRKELRHLASEWHRERGSRSPGNGSTGGYGSATWRVIAAFLGARRRWAQAYSV